MFGREQDLILVILALAAGTALAAGLIAWLVSRRYGWRAALVLPPAMLLGAAGTVWREGGLDLGLMGHAAVLAAPAVLGALVGLVVGARRG